MVVVVAYIYLIRKWRPDIFVWYWYVLVKVIFRFCMFIEEDRSSADFCAPSSITLSDIASLKRLSFSERHISHRLAHKSLLWRFLRQ